MIREFDGKKPKIAASAFVSEWAYIVGDVEIGEGTGVWPGAVIRGDYAKIKIGKNCAIEDNCVIHAGRDLQIGDEVIIAHGVVVHCARIGNRVLVGNNATILDYAEIGDDCIISANSLVATGSKIPNDSFVVGVPARIRKEPASSVKARMHKRTAGPGSETANTPRYFELIKKYKQAGL